MSEHEQAGFEASLRARWYCAEDVPVEEPARSEWLRGWERGHAPMEACVDVFREVMHAWHRGSEELGAAHELYRRDRLSAAEYERLRKAIDGDRDAQWHRVRPALRLLVAAVRAVDKGET